MPRPPAQPPPGRRRVVAELGRPETPEETAARKAESARTHREHQTVFNLLIALAACLGIVLFLVIVVVRPSFDATPRVDYQKLASQAQPTVSETLARPTLPSGWSANSARLRTGSDGVVSWTIGFITPTPQYIGLAQGMDANPTWVSSQLDGARPTGDMTIEGTTWTVYDHRSETPRDSGSSDYAYAMSTTIGGSSFVLRGSADAAQFRILAAALAGQLAEASDQPGAEQ